MDPSERITYARGKDGEVRIRVNTDDGVLRFTSSSPDELEAKAQELEAIAQALREAVDVADIVNETRPTPDHS